LNWGENGSHKTRKGRWSQAEIAKLRDLYGLRDDKAIARELRRSQTSVRRMAETMFRQGSTTGPWSAQEVRRLKKYLGATTTEVISRILGRPELEVNEKIFELGRIQNMGRWSRQETIRFKRIYGTRSDEDLAKIFGRTLEQVQKNAEKLCLAKDKAFLKKVSGKGATRMPRWSNAELELLRELYPSTSNLDIAQQLQRSVKSIVSKAHHVGLKKDLDRLREMGRQNVSLRYNVKGG
jgi:hypothetical protein